MTNHPQQQAVPVETINGIITQAKESFEEKTTSLHFSEETLYAIQVLTSNNYAAQVAVKNPMSLRMAIVNCAAIGLTLNPKQQLAYLIPRKGNIVLDISYRGLIAIAKDTGSIEWAKPQLVYKKDTFEYHGVSTKPTHIHDPFATDNGPVKGGYCETKLPNGDLLIECMSLADMDKIKQCSAAFANGGDSPYVLWEDQMQLKAIVKRASKWWPTSSRRFAEAVHILNHDNGEGLAHLHENNAVTLPPPPDPADVSESLRLSADQLIQRADTQGTEAVNAYIQDRFRNPIEQSYLLDQVATKSAFNQ